MDLTVQNVRIRYFCRYVQENCPKMSCQIPKTVRAPRTKEFRIYFARVPFSTWSRIVSTLLCKINEYGKLHTCPHLHKKFLASVRTQTLHNDRIRMYVMNNSLVRVSKARVMDIKSLIKLMYIHTSYTDVANAWQNGCTGQPVASDTPTCLSWFSGGWTWRHIIWWVWIPTYVIILMSAERMAFLSLELMLDL